MNDRAAVIMLADVAIGDKWGEKRKCGVRRLCAVATLRIENIFI